MKRLMSSLLALMLMLGLSGCTEREYQVFNNKITNNTYKTESAGKGKSPKRIIGVFSKSDDILFKINSAIQTVLKSYKSFDTIKVKKTTQGYSQTDIQKDCNYKVRIGYYGSYKNIYERNQLFNICYDQSPLWNKNKVTSKIYTGSSLSVGKSDLSFAKTNKGKRYFLSIITQMKTIDDYFVVYYSNQPSSMFKDDFIKFNNKLIEEFNKIGLKNKLTTVKVDF